MYNSTDNIPMKVFIKILDTGYLSLLGEGHQKPLQDVWQDIIDEYKEIDPDNQFQKVLNISKDVEYYKCKYHSINLAIQCLSVEKDNELIDLLNSWGYTVRLDNYEADLKRAKAYSKSILKNIKDLEGVLKDESKGEKSTFDETIIQLNMVLGYKEADANTITVSGYYALKKIAHEKIALMKKNK